jgi:hypothetical protein
MRDIMEIISHIEALPESQRRALPDWMKIRYIQEKTGIRPLVVGGDPVDQARAILDDDSDIDPKATKVEREESFFYHRRAGGWR